MPQQNQPDRQNHDDDNRPSSNSPDGGKNSPSQGGGPGGKGPNNNLSSRSIYFWVLIAALLLLLAFVVTSTQNQARMISAQDFVTHAKEKHFTDDGVTVYDERFVGTLRDDVPVADEGKLTQTRRVAAKIDPSVKEYYIKQLDPIVKLNYDPGTSLLLPILLNWGPLIIIGLFLWFVVFRSFRGAGGGAGMLGNFGRSRHKIMNKEHSNVMLSDVAGIDEAKEEVGEIIEFLKNPKKFQRLGGRVPRGVLLIGNPGCGKTLLAKAVAGEADVPFFSISGSDFVEMFVGVGASRVRDLFKQAKDSSPCIIFLDEIDAVGRRRGSGFSSGGHDEREQTLNAILVEMDGFDTNDQVIVMAATNRNDVLDPALTRPGRFDRQIHVPLPDIKGRLEILKVHSRRIKMSPHVDLERLARGTPMFSGADLAAIINEAAIAATLLNKDFVEQEDLEEARDKVKFGKARKSQKVEQDERVATAYHEAGHAVVQKQLKHADPLHKVTIIPRGQAMGATFSLPEKDRYGYGYRYLHDTMRVLCGGRIAEQKKTGDVSSGAAMDIRMATAYARHMILEWGMSEKLGFVNYSGSDTRELFIPEKDYSDHTAKVIDEEVKRMIDEAYRDAVKVIEENWDKIVALAEALLKYETLSSDDVDRLMRGDQLSKPTVSDLLAAETAKLAPKPQAKASDKPDTAPGGPGAFPSPA
ncbi:MAG: ATP-dependent zinc metalloprotease FtsH [Phycisphaera sp.]|nr:ATP-dependent zinc metalloprotease FtsH [Phycisphaera sp.]